MNIAFFLGSYPGIGGTETVTNMLAEWLVESGGAQNVSVIVWKRGEHRLPNDIGDVFYLPDCHNINSEENMLAVLDYVANRRIHVIINQGPCWKGTKRLRDVGCRLISALHYAPTYKIDNNRNAIDRLYRNSYGKGLSYKVKTFIRHSFREYFAKRDFYRVDSPVLRETVENSDAFVLLVEPYIDEWKKLLKLGDNDNLHAINNPIVVSQDVSNVRTDKSKCLLFVGRLTAWDKRVDRLLYMWSELQTEYKYWRLCIVGDGEERESLQALTKDLKLERIEFTGYKDPHPYYRDADILCVTSSSEGYPMVILEAASYCCPAIAYGVSSGVKEVIENGSTGFLVEPFRKDEYLTKLKWLMDNQKEREYMGRKAYARLAKYNIDKIGKQWTALFKQIGVER